MEETYLFAGYTATVKRPARPNGKWIWKTEFYHDFEGSEEALFDLGYTRVNYKISDMYGSPRAVDLMYAFHRDVVARYGLCPKANLFGFSRGGLYAFNYALRHPDLVEKVYLDAPVLDLRSWPLPSNPVFPGMLAEYGVTAEELKTAAFHPVENLDRYFALGIPTLVVAGDADKTVPLSENAGVLLAYAKAHGFRVTSVIKPGCGHHPHSLEDPAPIIKFIEGDATLSKEG